MLGGIVIAAIGIGIGYYIRKSIAEAKISSAEEEAKRIIEETTKNVEAKQREVL